MNDEIANQVDIKVTLEYAPAEYPWPAEARQGFTVEIWGTDPAAVVAATDEVQKCFKGRQTVRRLELSPDLVRALDKAERLAGAMA